VCALLFFATTLNYLDRQVFSVLAPYLQGTIGWNELQYGYIVAAFQTAYGIGLLASGRIMDRLGTQRGYAYAVGFWSVAAMAPALAFSPFTFGAARFALGLSESGNFPAAIKTVAEWFPARERAFATGIFNSGSNVGAVLAPLVVPWIAIHYSWRWAFVITGMMGLVWLLFWGALYRKPDHSVEGDSNGTHISWTSLLRFRQTWAFATGKFLTDPVWWFYLFWLPKFLNQKYGLDLSQIGAPIIVVYLAADFGSIGGGWLSLFLIRSGWSVNASRKTAMLVCALAVLPIMLATEASLWTAVALLSLATAAHQGWSVNLFTLTSDMFPKGAVGSVVGFGGAVGAVGSALVSTAVGYVLHVTGSYVGVFILAGSMYLLALGIIHALVPRLEPARQNGY